MLFSSFLGPYEHSFLCEGDQFSYPPLIQVILEATASICLLQEVFPDAPVLDQVPVLPAEPSPYLITLCVTDVRQ